MLVRGISSGSGNTSKGSNGGSSKGSILKYVASKVISNTKSTGSSGYSGNNSNKNYSSYTPSSNFNITTASGNKTDVLNFPNTNKIKNVVGPLNRIWNNLSSSNKIKSNKNTGKRTVTIQTASGNHGSISYIQNMETAKSTKASIATFFLSMVGGVGKVAEGLLDTGIDVIGNIESSVVSLVDPSYGKALLETTKSMIEYDIVGNAYDSAAETTGIKKNANNYEEIKNVGFGIGDMLTKIALMVGTGGAAAPIIGLADAGNKVESRLKAGDSLEDANISGAVAGAFSTVGWLSGGAINKLTPFANEAKNIALRVGLDSGTGALDGAEETVASTIKRYVHGDNKSILNIFNEEAEKNNLSASMITGAVSAGAMSLLGEFFGITKKYQENTKNKSVKIQSQTQSRINSEIDSRTPKIDELLPNSKDSNFFAGLKNNSIRKVDDVIQSEGTPIDKIRGMIERVSDEGNTKTSAKVDIDQSGKTMISRSELDKTSVVTPLKDAERYRVSLDDTSVKSNLTANRTLESGTSLRERINAVPKIEESSASKTVSRGLTSTEYDEYIKKTTEHAVETMKHGEELNRKSNGYLYKNQLNLSNETMKEMTDSQILQLGRDNMARKSFKSYFGWSDDVFIKNWDNYAEELRKNGIEVSDVKTMAKRYGIKMSDSTSKGVQTSVVDPLAKVRQINLEDDIIQKTSASSSVKTSNDPLAKIREMKFDDSGQTSYKSQRFNNYSDAKFLLEEAKGISKKVDLDSYFRGKQSFGNTIFDRGNIALQMITPKQTVGIVSNGISVHSDLLKKVSSYVYDDDSILDADGEFMHQVVKNGDFGYAARETNSTIFRLFNTNEHSYVIEFSPENMNQYQNEQRIKFYEEIASINETLDDNHKIMYPSQTGDEFVIDSNFVARQLSQVKSSDVSSPNFEVLYSDRIADLEKHVSNLAA